MRGAQLFEMVEKRGQPFYLIELKLYLISKSRAKALDLREERGVRISQRRGPLGRRILILILILVLFNRFAHPAGLSVPWFLDSLLLHLMHCLLLPVWLLVIVAWCLVPQYDVQ